jgi:hypothetical protein
MTMPISASPQTTPKRLQPQGPRRLTKGYRRVGAGDQHQNGRVIEDAQDRFGGWVLNGVVEGRGGIEQNQGRAEDRTADDMPGGTVKAGKGGEHAEAADGQHDAEAMGDAVGDFLASLVAAGGRSLTHVVFRWGDGFGAFPRIV